ncbi:MAG TPA: gliding motility-associated C-terminal domain-containing protein [Mucilaginibacter sp.]|nr:gliding motility-associated C-terminal domain-containing protein [Mucilaginibacter sp.]
MIKRGTRYLAMLVPLLLVYLSVCARDTGPRDDSTETKEKPHFVFAPGHIISFKIPQQIAIEEINETNHSISIVVHEGVDVTALTPTILLDQPGSTVSPGSGVTQDFTSAVAYHVDGPSGTFYSVNVLPTRTPAPICSGTSANIIGDPPPPPGTLTWQMLNTTTGLWVNAAGANNSANYQTQILTNSSTTPKVFTFRRQIFFSGFYTYDSYNDITVYSKTTISNNTITQPAPNAFCVAGDMSVITGSSPSGGIGTYTYQWQSSPDNVTFTDISGATSIDYDPPALNQTTYFRRIVTSGTCTSPTKSNVVKETVLKAITNNLIYAPPTTSYCGIATVAIINGNIPSGGTGTFQYQWQQSPDGVTFTDIPGANNNDYNQPALTQTTYYRRMATSGVCSSPITSNQVVITVEPGLSNNSITAPAVSSFCGPGNPTVITATAAKGGNNIYQYQWQSSPDGGTFADIPGATNLGYDPPLISQTTYYRRTVTSGSCTTPLISNQIKITIEPVLAANDITAPATTTFCATGKPSAIVGSSPTGGDGTYAYIWQSSINGGATFVDISGANAKDYTPPTLTTTTSFRRTVTSGACTTPLISGTVTITILPALGANSITAPATVTFCISGDPATISGTTPTGGTGTYQYQWQSSTDDISFVNITGATSKDYDSPSLNATTYFRRTVTSGACSTPLISNEVKITVYKAVSNNAITAPAPSGFCGPGNAGTIKGTTPINGDGTYTYQWQSSADNITFVDIAGANGKDFDPPAAGTSIFYRRSVTSGICSTPVLSNVVEIHVTPPLTGNTIGSPLITTFCLSVDPAVIPGGFPTGGDGAGSYNYQWQRSLDDGNTWTDIPGANSIDYDPPPLSATTSIRRTVTSGACLVPLPSNVVKFTILNTPANVTVNPVAAICAGSGVTLSVNSPDPNLTYVWYDSPSRNNALFQGPVYTPPVLNATQTFYVEATNGSCSSPVLTTVTVTVNSQPTPPVLTTNPVNVCEGSQAILRITNPQPGYQYNWYTQPTGGSPVATTVNFTTQPLTSGTTFYAEAVNSTGCVSASRTVVNISVTPLPVITVQNASICPGDPATLISSNNDPDITVNWYSAPTGGNILFTGDSFTTPPLSANTDYYAEAVNGMCAAAARAKASVQMIQPLSPPIVHVQTAIAPTIIFEWAPVMEATGYLVSTDDGVTFTEPSSGSNGTTHTVTGLQIGQSVTIIVRSLGNSACETSSNSTPLTARALNPDINQIFVANAFTPNGDGKNDIVYVRNENIKTLKFYVYDQWGELLFTSMSQQQGWDGTFKGKTEPAGVYVYYLEAMMNNGERVTKKGTITLLR